MDNRKNRSGNLIPVLSPPAHVHLMGICGTAMAALAGMFKQSGFRVTGSDQAAYPPISDHLAKLGISVMEGYSAANLDPAPDLAVVGNVIRKTNTEAVALLNSGIPYGSMPEVLNEYFSKGKTRVVVAGTHGKTTVSSMTAWVLYANGRDPGFMIGGIPNNFGTNYRLGEGPHFVIEGDEYDTAFFDKGPKFLHYGPCVAVITSCEFDHGDIYRDLTQIETQFRAFARLVPENGTLLCCAEDDRVLNIGRGAGVPLKTYGFDHDCDWSVARVGGSGRELKARFSNHTADVTAVMPFMGDHNLLNALAAVAAGHEAGINLDSAVSSLQGFLGVKRRQQILGEFNGIKIVDDFAHHPTEVRETCAAVKSGFPERRLVAVFEPRTNTSKRSIFQQHYFPAFDAADIVILRSPRDADHIAEDERFSSDALAEKFRASGKSAVSFPDTDGILEYLNCELKTGDLVLVMSNGSFDNLNDRLLKMLRER